MKKLALALFTLCLGVSAAADDYRLASDAEAAYKNGDYTEARSLAQALKMSADVNLQIYGLMIEGVTHPDPAIGGKLLSGVLDLIRTVKTTSKQQRDYLNQVMHKALIAEITLSIQCKELPTAYAKLRAYEDKFPGADRGPIALARSEIAFLEHEYSKALALAENAYALYLPKEPGRAAQVLIKVGLYQMLNDKMEEGFKSTLKAQAGLVKEGDADQYYFTLVNMLIYHKSRGTDGGSLVKSINHRLKQEPDKDLQMLLAFAKDWVP